MITAKIEQRENNQFFIVYSSPNYQVGKKCSWKVTNYQAYQGFGPTGKEVQYQENSKTWTGADDKGFFLFWTEDHSTWEKEKKGEKEMEKVELFIGQQFEKQKRVLFSGELVCSRQTLDDPSSDSRGCYQTLYKVLNGFRVYTENWSQWKGEDEDNYMELTEVLQEQELIEQYGALATKAGIIEFVDFPEESKQGETICQNCFEYLKGA